MNLRKPIFLKRCFLLLSGMILLTACGRDDSASLSEQLDYMIRKRKRNGSTSSGACCT